MRFHVLGLPQAGTTRAYYVCGFIPAIVNFCRMMKDLGHEVILYGHEENEATVDEHVAVISKKESERYLGGVHFVAAPFESQCGLWAMTNRRMSDEIGKRKRPGDLVALLGGSSQEAAIAVHKELKIVEYMIGYLGRFAPFAVYCSQSWRQYSYGIQKADDNRWWDATIPLYFDPAEFALAPAKKDFLLFVGRITERKGYKIAIEVAEKAGLPLKVVGPGPLPDFPAHVEGIGIVTVEERAQLMGEARALLAPTTYNEPFGAVVIEANLCGTPVITTDWGSFPELIDNGVNGYRCNLMREFLSAVEQVPKLSPAAIRERAIARYSLDVIKPQYAAYFDRIAVHGTQAGWYAS